MKKDAPREQPPRGGGAQEWQHRQGFRKPALENPKGQAEYVSEVAQGDIERAYQGGKGDFGTIISSLFPYLVFPNLHCK